MEGPVHPLSGWLAAKAAIFYIPYNLYATHPPGATRPRIIREIEKDPPSRASAVPPADVARSVPCVLLNSRMLASRMTELKTPRCAITPTPVLRAAGWLSVIP